MINLDCSIELKHNVDGTFILTVDAPGSQMKTYTLNSIEEVVAVLYNITQKESTQ